MLLCPSSGSKLSVKLRVIANAAMGAGTLGGILGITAERPLPCWPFLPPVFRSEETISDGLFSSLISLILKHKREIYFSQFWSLEV